MNVAEPVTPTEILGQLSKLADLVHKLSGHQVEIVDRLRTVESKTARLKPVMTSDDFKAIALRWMKQRIKSLDFRYGIDELIELPDGKGWDDLSDGERCCIEDALMDLEDSLADWLDEQ